MKRIDKFLIIIFGISILLIGILFSFAQSNAEFLNSQGFSGLFVPDAVNLRDSILFIIEQKEFKWESNYITFIGVVIIYAPAALLGSWLYLFINSTMLCLGLFYFTKVLEFYKINETSRIKLILIASFVVTINPYLMAAIGYPNKEIPLILISNMYLYYALSNAKRYSIFLISLVAYIFRDGYGLILVSLSFLILFFGKINFKYKYLICTLIILLAFSFLNLSNFAFLGLPVERNLALEEYNVFPRYGYYYKLLGNNFNLGFRPQFFAIDGSLYLLTIGYWMLGVCIVSSFIKSIANIADKNDAKAKISFILIFTMLAVTFGSFIHPRYLMPFIMVMTIYLRGKTGLVSLLACIFFPIIFYLNDSLPELQEGIISD